METMNMTPILFPYDPNEFWKMIKSIIREEMEKRLNVKPANVNEFTTPGLTYKPLLKINEVCNFFQVTRPTIYDWVKRGKLKQYKVISRVYFLWDDIQKLLKPVG